MSNNIEQPKRRRIQQDKKTKKVKAKKISLISIIRLVSFLVILICIGIIIYRYINLKKADKIIESLNNDIQVNDKNIEVNGATATLIDTDVNSLKQKNSDTVGYIKINGTNINYPVVQSNDNDYYLKHSFTKSYSQSGWIFLDYRNNIDTLDKNNIIYGHNMINGTMFSNLTKMLNKNFFNDDQNLYINLDTQTRSTLWKIFSVYVTNPETYYLSVNFKSDSEYLDFINNIKSKSMYSFNENLNSNDKILTLSTCTNLNTKRLVIHAKLIFEENK